MKHTFMKLLFCWLLGSCFGAMASDDCDSRRGEPCYIAALDGWLISVDAEVGEQRFSIIRTDGAHNQNEDVLFYTLIDQNDSEVLELYLVSPDGASSINPMRVAALVPQQNGTRMEVFECPFASTLYEMSIEVTTVIDRESFLRVVVDNECTFSAPISPDAIPNRVEFSLITASGLGQGCLDFRYYDYTTALGAPPDSEWCGRLPD